MVTLRTVGMPGTLGTSGTLGTLGTLQDCDAGNVYLGTQAGLSGLQVVKQITRHACGEGSAFVIFVFVFLVFQSGAEDL